MLIIVCVVLSVTVVATTLSADRAISLINAAMVPTLGNSSLALLSFLHKPPNVGSVQIGAALLITLLVLVLAVGPAEPILGGARAD